MDLSNLITIPDDNTAYDVSKSFVERSKQECSDS